MENLETGKDKIKQICEVLKKETLQPAKQEAQQIIEVAQQEAQQIIKEAESKAAAIFSEGKAKMEKERELFTNSLTQACRQGMEALKQDIENKLFNAEISDWIEKQTVDPELSAKLIQALVEAVGKEGISADFSVLIPAKVPAEQINALLGKEILEKLREKEVIVGDFMGGVALKLHDRRLILDLTDGALKELIGQYVRKDFRELLFQT